MKKWLKKYIPTSQSLQDSSVIKRLKSHFNSSCFWSRDHQAIARGVAAGLASSVIPGVQIFYAALLVILLRGNLAIALFFTFVSNPLTVVPITYFIYSVGKLVIGNGQTDLVLQNFEWDFSSFHAFWSNVSTWILHAGKAFLVGMPIVSFCLGLFGYFATILIWKTSVIISPKK